MQKEQLGCKLLKNYAIICREQWSVKIGITFLRLAKETWRQNEQPGSVDLPVYQLEPVGTPPLPFGLTMTRFDLSGIGAGLGRYSNFFYTVGVHAEMWRVFFLSLSLSLWCVFFFRNEIV